MRFELLFTKQADEEYQALEKEPSKKAVLKAVRKTLGLLETNLRHPSLHTYEFTTLKGPRGEKVFEAYAQNNTPGAYRVFWYYGPNKQQISIASIVPHP
ncbi:MAG: hypothetical protein A2293_15860 [Elusimicrobia bacterium RIFOXYB2_FULL_49_7]|nr:MAG: hypothetical protein A2293_15860 [Elusimicrobia bacterium RIFOXYB2_FULL_49_7]